MKKTFRKVLMLAFAGLSAGANLFAYSGGDGSMETPYLISSREDMEELATNVNAGQTQSGKYFWLTRDLTGEDDTIKTVIGNSLSRCFSGHFNGNGHKIAAKRGIFGAIKSAVVSNLEVYGRITSVSFSTSETIIPGLTIYYYYTGGICAYATESSIINCQNSASMQIIYTALYRILYTGGICGVAKNSTISNCFNNADLVIGSTLADSSTGGICGHSVGSTIKDCYDAENIVALSYGVAGGICGRN
jgi:hypothetical protein